MLRLFPRTRAIVFFALLLCCAFTSHATRGHAEMPPLQGDALKFYWLEGGRVSTAGTTLDRPVERIPAEIGGDIRYWSVIDPDVSGVVQESEAGVWFFSAKGVALRHVPLGSVYECQDVFFSPDGSVVIIMTGSGMRPDVTFQVYGKAPEMLAEFAGIRTDDFPWLDASRFVITRIDDTRTGPNYDDPEKNTTGKSYGWRTSVVLFDAATKKSTVLKEATATRNFWSLGAVDNGKAVEGKEEYVTSEADWGDADKEQTRDFRVDIPSADKQ